MAYAGVEAYASGDYLSASEKLERSYSIVPVPTLGLWSARALVKLGKWVEAEARYAAVASMVVAASDSPVQRSAQLDAARERQDLREKLPRLTLKFSGATPDQVVVRIDGVVVRQSELATSQPLNPGRHVILGSRGSDTNEVSLDIAAGAHEELWLRFTPEVAVNLQPPWATSPSTASTGMPEGTRSALNTAGKVGLVAGSAALTMSLVAYVVARRKYDEFERRDLCVRGDCSPAEVDLYQTWRTVHLVSLVSGALLAGTGAGLLLLTPTPERGLNVSVSLGAGSASLVGSF